MGLAIQTGSASFSLLTGSRQVWQVRTVDALVTPEILGTGDADDAVGGAEGIEETVVGSAHDNKAAKGTVDDEGVP